MRFQDKVVVVTGAAVGIGQAALVAFCPRSAHVALVDRDRERGLALLDDLQRAGYEALAVGADVADENDVRAMVEQVVDRWDRLDVWSITRVCIHGAT